MAFIDSVEKLEALCASVNWLENYTELVDIADFEAGFIVLPFFLALEKLRPRIGLAVDDESLDIQIDAAVEMALEIIEDFLDRKLQCASETEIFTHKKGETISLIRYPVTEISSISSTSGGDIKFHYDAKNGLIKFDHFVYSHEITIAYEGGYKTLPAALELCLLKVFDKIYTALFDPDSAQSETVKAMKAGDLQITYDTGASFFSNAASGEPINIYIGADIAGLLRMYRRQSA